ncbi:MAG: hypothetical protein HY760_03070 [Nitrospirae bacterium]|nr:hypothetical protein [Nitrospirota bacterium]
MPPTPERIELSPQEAETLQEIGDLFTALGFDLDSFGGRTFLLRAVPALLSGEDPVRLVREVLSEWRRSERRMGVDDLLMELTGRQACRRAVRRGTFMGEAAMAALIRQLFETAMPYTCPHGRPVVWRIPLEEIEKRFERR